MNPGKRKQPDREGAPPAALSVQQCSRGSRLDPDGNLIRRESVGSLNALTKVSANLVNHDTGPSHGVPQFFFRAIEFLAPITHLVWLVYVYPFCVLDWVIRHMASPSWEEARIPKGHMPPPVNARLGMSHAALSS